MTIPARCSVCGREAELADHDGDLLCQQCLEPEALPGSTTGGCGVCGQTPCVCDWVPSYD